MFVLVASVAQISAKMGMGMSQYFE